MEPTKERGGAALFYLLLVAASGVLLWEASRIRGSAEVSGPATVPLIAGTTMLIASLALLGRELVATGRRWLPTFADLRGLLPLRILAYMLFCALYVATIEVVGFWASSAVFLALSFVALNKSRWLHALGITAGTLAIVYLLFVYVFRIYLP